MIKKTKEIKQVNIGYQLKNQAIKRGGGELINYLFTTKNKYDKNLFSLDLFFNSFFLIINIFLCNMDMRVKFIQT